MKKNLTNCNLLIKLNKIVHATCILISINKSKFYITSLDAAESKNEILFARMPLYKRLRCEKQKKENTHGTTLVCCRQNHSKIQFNISCPKHFLYKRLEKYTTQHAAWKLTCKIFGA